VLADIVFRCYNASQHMADWKQITARIRRARTSKDPARADIRRVHMKWRARVQSA